MTVQQGYIFAVSVVYESREVPYTQESGWEEQNNNEAVKK
jgi:hypothetical protein